MKHSKCKQCGGEEPFKKQPVWDVKMVLSRFLKLHTKGRTFHHPIGYYPITLKCGGGLHLKMESVNRVDWTQMPIGKIQSLANFESHHQRHGNVFSHELSFMSF